MFGVFKLNGKNQVALQLVAPLLVITIIVTAFEALEHINLKNNLENRLSMVLRRSPLGANQIAGRQPNGCKKAI